jgi:hypothetical protein
MSSLARVFTLLAGLMIAGCTITVNSPMGVAGTGTPTPESRPVAPFTAVSARNGVHVDLHEGSPAAVVVVAQPNLLDIISTTVDNGELTISATRSYTTTERVTVTVTSPHLTGVSASGGVAMSGTDFASTELTVKAEGGSVVTLSGTATRLDAQASGGAILDLGSLAVTDATISFSGGVKATLKVSGHLRGTASGGVVVDLAASPASVTVDASGGAVVKYP